MPVYYIVLSAFVFRFVSIVHGHTCFAQAQFVNFKNHIPILIRML